MKEQNVIFQVPGELRLNGKVVRIPNPAFYIGQTVHLMDEDSHPVDLLPRTIASAALTYITQEDNPMVLLSEPSWAYSLQDNLSSNIRYCESRLMSHSFWLDAVQTAIDDSSMTLEETIKAFYKHPVRIHKEDIQGMWENLEKLKIDFPYSDLKETARIYLGKFK